jgi:hypothetical protein
MLSTQLYSVGNSSRARNFDIVSKSHLLAEIHSCDASEVVQFGEDPKFRSKIFPPSSGSKSKPSKKPAMTWLRLLFDLVYGGDIFLRDVELSTKLHGVTTEKTILFVVTSVRAYDHTKAK